MNKLQRGALAALVPAGIGYVFARRDQVQDDATRLSVIADAVLLHAEDVTRRLSDALGEIGRVEGGAALFDAVSARTAAHCAASLAGARCGRLRSRRPLAMFVVTRRGVSRHARQPLAAGA